MMHFVFFFILCYAFKQVIGQVLEPHVYITKSIKLTNEDGSKAEVKIALQHSKTSSNDAYGLSIIDTVYGIYVVNIEGRPSNIFKNDIKKTGSTSEIQSNVSVLNVGSTAVLVYHIEFSATTQVNSSSSRAEVTWKNGQPDSPTFGPAYTDLVCIKKAVKFKESIIPNYGYIILGIVLGIVIGVVIAALILFCLRRYPVTKKYILHTNEIADLNPDVESAGTVLAPPAYDEILQGNDKNPKQNGFLSRFTRNETKEKVVDPSIEKLMWRSDLLRGDMDSMYKKLNGSDSYQYVTLLEYSLHTFVHTWKITLQSNIEALHTNTDISLEDKNKYLKVLPKLFTPFMDSLQTYHNVKSSDVVLETAATTTLKIYRCGTKFYNDILESIKPKTTPLSRTKDHVVLKEQQKKHDKELERHKEKIEEYKETLREAYTTLFAKWLDCCHNVAGVWLEEHLYNIVNCLSLILYEELFSLLHSWINTSVIKQLDLLRRKRRLSEKLDVEFQAVFKYELEQVTTYLEKAKAKIVSQEEEKCFSLDADVKNEMHQHYQKIADEMRNDDKNILQYGEKAQKVTKPTDKLVDEKFELCFEYADVARNSTHDCSENLMATHISLIEMMKKSLDIFLNRMKTHALELFRTKIDVPDLMTDSESLNAEPIEMRKPSEVNYLKDIIDDVQEKIEELTAMLLALNDENNAELKEHNQAFRDYYSGLLMKRKSECLDVINKSHLLFKSVIQCHGPLSWTNSEVLIDNAPNYCVAAVLNRFFSTDVINSVKVEDHVDWIKKEKKVILGHWTIMKKVNLTNQIINSEINETYEYSKKRLADVAEIERESSSIQKFVKGHFSNLMYHSRELQHEQQVVKTTTNFLTSILKNMGESAKGTSADTTESIATFKKTVKGLLKSSRQEITPEAEQNLKDHLLKKLEDYVATCASLNFSVPSEFLATVTFNTKQLAEHLFQLGKHFQKFEDKLTVAKRVVNENLLLIHALLHQNVIEEQEMMPLLKDLSLFLSPDEIEDISNRLLGGEKSKDFQQIFDYMLAEKKEEETADNNEDESPRVRKRKKSKKSGS